MTIPAVGTLSYNGYTFPGERHVTVSLTPAYDESKRSVIYHEFRLEVVATIQDNEGTGDSLEYIRSKLTQRGGVLTYTGDGFGNLLANGTAKLDASFGPSPEILSWIPTGSSRACEIQWVVTTRITPCSALYGVMALNFSVAFSIDKHGDATRTVTGYYEIAATVRNGSRVLSQTADDYLYVVQPEPIISFMRTTFERKLSLDKRRMDFTIVDEQIKSRNAYPAYAVEIKGNQVVDWGRSRSGFFQSTMDMDITTSSRVVGVTAWHIFGNILLQRLRYAKRSGMTVLIDSIRIEEDIFGRSGSFSAGFRFLYTPPSSGSTSPSGTPGGQEQDADKIFEPSRVFLDMINRTGLWLPTTSTWKQWRDSMLTTMFNPIGTSGIRLRPGDDRLVDSCGNDFVLRLPQDRVFLPSLTSPLAAEVANEVPAPEKSYMYSSTSLEPMIQYPVAMHVPIQTTSGDDSTGVDVTTPQTAISIKPFTFTPLGGEALENSIHTRGNGHTEIRFKGAAIRAGYEIPRPKVQRIGDQTATERGGSFKISQGPNLLGVQTYVAAWDIVYITPRPPQDIRTLA